MALIEVKWIRSKNERQPHIAFRSNGAHQISINCCRNDISLCHADRRSVGGLLNENSFWFGHIWRNKFICATKRRDENCPGFALRFLLSSKQFSTLNSARIKCLWLVRLYWISCAVPTTKHFHAHMCLVSMWSISIPSRMPFRNTKKFFKIYFISWHKVHLILKHVRAIDERLQQPTTRIVRRWDSYCDRYGTWNWTP